MGTGKYSMALEHSEPVHSRGAQKLRRKPDPETPARVTLILKLRGSREELDARLAEYCEQAPGERDAAEAAALKHLMRPEKRSLAGIEAFAKARGLKVREADRTSGHVVLAGRLGDLARAFGVEAALFEHAAGRYRSHEGPVHIPGALSGVVDAVLGLDERPLARRHAIGFHRDAAHHILPADVARFYHFPQGTRGRGQSIGIIELGGGFHHSDVREYLRGQGLRVPPIKVIELEGAKNAPAKPRDVRRYWDSLSQSRGAGHPVSEAIEWTIETSMDVELAGALANQVRLLVYFTPNTARGKYHAFAAALRSGKGRPSVLSCSWGAHEETFPLAYIKSLERLFRLAAVKGVTICCSSGDDGDGSEGGGGPRVNYPGSSPWVLCCGGTTLQLAGHRESVWNEVFAGQKMASTGGASRVFPLPAWQGAAGVRAKTSLEGRGVPDVAAKADLGAGYAAQVGGVAFPMGGTSAAAPLWASLIARLNEKLPAPAGYLNPWLYRKPARRALQDITKGDNGRFFKAGRGWDPCTGWGTPDGEALLAALKGKT